MRSPPESENPRPDLGPEKLPTRSSHEALVDHSHGRNLLGRSKHECCFGWGWDSKVAQDDTRRVITVWLETVSEVVGSVERLHGEAVDFQFLFRRPQLRVTLIAPFLDEVS